MLCMETVLKVKRLYHKEGLSQRAIAQQLQLNRRTVSKYLNTKEPPVYKREQYQYPKLGAFIPLLGSGLINIKKELKYKKQSENHNESFILAVRTANKHDKALLPPLSWSCQSRRQKSDQRYHLCD